jgi:hypothetical protein
LGIGGWIGGFRDTFLQADTLLSLNQPLALRHTTSLSAGAKSTMLMSFSMNYNQHLAVNK